MRKTLRNLLKYGFLIVVGLIMIYPMIWMFFSSFKSNAEIFGSLSLFPKVFDWTSFSDGWKGSGQFTYSTFFLNSIRLVVPTVLCTAVSTIFVSYGFARFHFPLKGPLFALMISTLMLPNAVVIIPRYILFRNLDWLDSYLPFWVPALFACYPFFIFMMVQFFRGLPRELDEAARIDGCNSLQTLFRILLPLSKPALVSLVVFQTVWTWEDFFNSLIYLNSVKNYTVSLALRMSLDVMEAVSWNRVLAMSVLSILPCVVIFFLAQRYFVEGISTTGLKG